MKKVSVEKMRKWTRILAAFLSLLMLLSLAACGATADSVVKNLLDAKNADIIRQKSYKTPEEFYRAVEMRRAKEIMGLVDGSANLETLASDALFLQNDLTVSFHQDALDRDTMSSLTNLAGTDLSWIRSAGLSFTTGKTDQLDSLGAALRFNGQDIVSANVVLDSLNSLAYVTVPELNSQYFTANLSDTMRSLLGARVSSAQVSEALSGSWFAPAQVFGLIEKYYGVALDNITKIQVENGTVSANGVSCKCSVASVKLNGDDLLRIAKACLTSAGGDTELEELVYNFLQVSGNYSDSALSFHRSYQDTLEKASNTLNYANSDWIPYNAEMTVYIDAKGEILGRRLDLQRGEQHLIFSFLTARDGSKLGVEFEAGSNYLTDSVNSQAFIRVIGGGNYASSGKLQGTFQVSFYELEAYDGRHDETDMALGTLSADGTIDRDGFIGELVLAPSPELMDQLSEELDLNYAPEPIARLIRSMSLAIVNKSEGDSTSFALSLRTDGKDLLDLSFSSVPVKAFPIEIPDAPVDLNTWTRSLGFASLNAILNNLSAAGVPNALMNSILR